MRQQFRQLKRKPIRSLVIKGSKEMGLQLFRLVGSSEGFLCMKVISAYFRGEGKMAVEK